MVRRSSWLCFGFPVLVGLSLATAGLADFLFYKHVVGWTLGGFVAWLLLFVLMRYGRSLLFGRDRVWGWALSLMTAGLCISLVLEPGVLAVVLAVIALGSLALLSRGAWPSAGLGWRWLGGLFGVWAAALVRPILDSRLAQRWRNRAATLKDKVRPYLRLAWAVAGMVIPVVLSLVFLGLFAIANPVVSDWMRRGLDRLGDFVFNASDYISVTRALLWYGAAFACWGLLRYRPRRSSRARPKETGYLYLPSRQSENPTAPPEPVKPVSSDLVNWLARQYQGLIIRSLVMINAVFAVQLVLDSRYLVLGESLPEGMTHAEYAHRGAYPLIVTALLAAAMVLAVFRPGGIAQRSAWARRLVILWVAQNVVLVVSAAWRLGAYVEVYTLTRLRVAAGVWMLMVAGCLVLLLWRIARSRDNTWLTGWAMGWGLAVLWVCSFVPFDPMIARYNVANCQELGGHAGPIDIAYLESLGPDALPAIDYLVEHLPPEAGEAPPAYEPEPGYERGGARIAPAANRWQEPEPGKQASLHDQLARMRGALSEELEVQLEDWRGWTVRRAWLRRGPGEE